MANKGVRETVTSELLRKETKKNVRIPYLSGAIRGMGELKFSLGGFIIEMKSTNKDFIDEIASMIEDIYQSYDIVERFESLHSYTNEYFYCIRIAAERSADLLEKCCIVRNKYEFIDNIPDELLYSIAAKKAFLKALYLSCGFLKVPELNEDDFDMASHGKNGYTLTFNLNSDIVRDDIVTLISNECLIDADTIKRKKNGCGIYLKSGEAICNVLTFIGAVEGALILFDIISSRKMRNDINRVNNCDIANINKVVDAGTKQIEAIKILENSGEYEFLGDVIKETCKMRKEYPDIGIKELGNKFLPPISKSCLNHRLRKIVSLAEEIKNREN